MTDSNAVPDPEDSDDVVKEYLRLEAAERTKLHRLHDSQRVWNPEHDVMGVVGEAQFSKEFGQAMDLSRRPRGDRGIDFTVPWAMTVDVKTARDPDKLIHAEGKCVADIYVLAAYNNDLTATLLGWTWGRTLKECPVRDFGDRGVPAHHIDAGRLQDMAILARRIMKPWRR